MTRERRRYFRVEDIIGLKTEVINPLQVEQRVDKFWSDQHEFSIRNDFNFKLEQHQTDLNTLRTKCRKWPDTWSCYKSNWMF